jgi:glycosyltransferase involved in cell wall biosynthesis
MAIQAQKLVNHLQKDGITVITCKTNADFPRGLRSLTKIGGLRTLVRTFFFLHDLSYKLPKIDIVYFLSGFKWFFLWVTMPALLIIKLYRKKVIVSGRGGAAEDFFRRWKIFGKLMLNLSDEVTVPSRFLQEAFYRTLSYYPKIVPNIVDLDSIQWRVRRKIYPRLIVTRHLNKIYNIKCIIKAFVLIKGHFPSAELAIVGDGPEEQNLKDMVKALGINNVKFYGAVPHMQLTKLYNKYDVFVNASNVDNFPGSIIEAFAAGLPVVTTRAGGIPYIVEDGKTGFLVNLNDHEQMAQKVIMFINNNNLALTMAKNARKESKKYTWNSIRKVFFETVLGGAQYQTTGNSLVDKM